MAAACGCSSIVAVTEHGDVYACGPGTGTRLSSALMPHPALPQEHEPARRSAGKAILIVAAGHYHHAMVDEDGALLTSGDGAYGRTGHGDEQPRRQLARLPREVFRGSPVTQVTCGWRHTLAITADGRAWTCGYNSNGQLGLGDTARRLVFTQVDAVQFRDARIVVVASGSDHSVAVSAEGCMWTWGKGWFGCLGHNDEQDRLAPVLLAQEQFEGSKIITVACGRRHSVAVGERGALWAWGYGSYGQLGLGHTENTLVPAWVGAEEVFGGSKVLLAACGFNHTLAVTRAGAVWAWGYGRHGQLGLNDELNRLSPTMLNEQCFALARIRAVAGGDRQSAAVTEHGELYTWGRGQAAGPEGNNGALGHTGGRDVRNRLLPALLPPHLLDGARVGRCHGLRVEHALAFCMGTHARLGAGTALAGAKGKRRSRRTQGKAAAAGEGKGCYVCKLPGELVRRVVEACVWGGTGKLGEGVVRLMGGGAGRGQGRR